HGEVGLWYAVAYSLVAYLTETSGEETLGELILALADNIPFEDALVQTVGLDIAQLEMAWRAWLGYPVDSIPTPAPFPTMPEVTIVPPTVPRGQPTRAPTYTPTPTALPEETPPGRPCLVSLVILLGSAVGWRYARRRPNG
ncbi:MAG: hypothetical protein H8E90_09100, partial [Anaerolineales bacterium]|nr:hypothetical protein [Anaerolineales bacterium]